MKYFCITHHGGKFGKTTDKKEMTHMKRSALLCALLAVLLIHIVSAGFTFGLHNGFIGYCDDSGVWTMTDIPEHSVPQEQDHAMLAQGIYLETEQALAKAMEDFCS